MLLHRKHQRISHIRSNIAAASYSSLLKYQLFIALSYPLQLLLADWIENSIFTMSHSSDRKRRRVMEGPITAAATISSLPHAVLQDYYCFAFVGPGHY